MVVNNGPRNRVESPFQGYPGIGAVHEVIPDHALRAFLGKFADVADIIITEGLKPPEINPIPEFQSEEDYELVPIVDAERRPYDPRRYYKVYSADQLGLTVLEMDTSMKEAKRVRKVIESQDFGAAEQDARNSLDRLDIPRYPSVTVNRVEGVGRKLPNTNNKAVRQKLALFPSTAKDLETHDMLSDEFEIVTGVLKRRFKQFITPTDMVSHITFAYIRPYVTDSEYVKLTNSMNEELASNPLIIEIEQRLKIRSRSERSQPDH